MTIKRPQETFHAYGLSWNVSKAMALVADGRVPNGQISTDRADMVHNGEVRMSKEACAPVDLSIPLLGLDFGSEGRLIMDGWHRIVQAHAEGVLRLPIHWLSGDDERAVRVQPHNKVWKAFDKQLEEDTK